MTEQEQIDALKDENLCLKDENSILEFQLKNRLNENVSLIEQIDALKAQVNCLRDALTRLTLAYGDAEYNSSFLVLSSTAEQCLAEVKAKAIEECKRQIAESKQIDMATKIMTIAV